MWLHGMCQSRVNSSGAVIIDSQVNIIKVVTLATYLYMYIGSFSLSYTFILGEHVVHKFCIEILVLASDCNVFCPSNQKYVYI